LEKSNSFQVYLSITWSISGKTEQEPEVVHCMGLRLAKNDFGSMLSSVLQKNCGFQFGFGFTKLTAISVFRSG